MKITFSTSSFDANLCNTHNATAMSCLSSILRRFLCSSSLRTHPFDAHPTIPEDDDPNKPNTEKPGIVARLMGLETLPEFGSVSTERTIRRSRSVSSARYWAEFDHSDMEHRRAKSSSSFREKPSFFNQEDDEFLVLSFEDVKEKKPKKGFKERREGRADNKENRRVEKPIIARKSCNGDISSSPSRKFCISREEIKDSSQNELNYKTSSTSTIPKTPLEARTKKKEESRKHRLGVLDVERERSSENSSPVSVLDLIEFASEPESLLSEDDSRLKGSNSRRKLSTELKIPDQRSLNSSEMSITNDGASKLIGPQLRNSTQEPSSRLEDNSEECQDICRLAEAEVQASEWIMREMTKMGDFEEIRIEFGLDILDHLLQEFVSELL